jgi:hypothetical protein
LTSEAILHDHASLCLNCEAPVSAHFCSQCGQETMLHVPSAREFLHEFVGHYVALEGKLLTSLRLLLFRPGRLTVEYLQGRRVRYVLPLRLYLTFSIIFFALFKFSGTHVAKLDDEDAKPRAAAHAQAERKGDRTAERKGDDDAPGDWRITIGGRTLGNYLEGYSPRLAAHANQFDSLSTEEKEHELKSAFFSYTPYAIFALMPVFALFLKLLYLGSGRRYGEHLLFALHTNAFAFLMLSLLLVAPGFVPFLHTALVLWLMFYLPTAMRRVYGGSRKLTFVRWIVLMLLHLLSMAAAILGAFGLAILA